MSALFYVRRRTREPGRFGADHKWSRWSNLRDCHTRQEAEAIFIDHETSPGRDVLREQFAIFHRGQIVEQSRVGR